VNSDGRRQRYMSTPKHDLVFYDTTRWVVRRGEEILIVSGNDLRFSSNHSTKFGFRIGMRASRD
jgi:hypothetical protein